jgi:methyl-accepting chemotaxis protein
LFNPRKTPAFPVDAAGRAMTRYPRNTMSFMNRHSLKTRLVWLTGATVLALVGVALAGGLGLSHSARDFERFIAQDVQALTHLGHLQGAANSLRRNEKDLLINLANEKKAKESIEDWKAAEAKARDALNGLVELQLSPAIGEPAAQMLKHLQTYEAGFGKVSAAALQGEIATPQDGNQAMRAYKTSVNAIEDGVVALEKLLGERQAERLGQHRRDDNRLYGALAAATALFAALVMIFARLVARSVIAPMAEAQMAAARIAERDLRGEITASGQDEAASLLRAMRDMQQSISAVLSGAKQSSDSIANASREVAAGSQDLSQRTERSAADLQVLASTMDEITQSVQQNSASAQEAKQLSDEASQVAHRGRSVVEEVVLTMQQISNSSGRIADIIATIDGIAFQTNILALNAAVEAARAGEQGRGFAVVAGEVRSLAQRSAEAAKEIKQLIGHSSEQVGLGVDKVERAGQTMGEIVQAVGRVSGIVGEISHATQEQSAGIRQVAEAVTRLDETTQQNAALVEESAAAAASLRTQANELATAVAVFKV